MIALTSNSPIIQRLLDKAGISGPVVRAEIVIEPGAIVVIKAEVMVTEEVVEEFVEALAEKGAHEKAPNGGSEKGS